jgi:hypothetical protein
MSAYTAYKTQLFRTDAVGRRVLAPYESHGDVVLISDDDTAERVARCLYASRLLTHVGIAASLVIAVWAPIALLGIVAVGIARRAYIRHLVAALAPAGIRAHQLPPVVRSERRAEYNVAFGRRRFWGLIVGGALITVIGAVAAVAVPEGQPRALDTTMWGCAFAMFGVYLLISSIQAVRSLPPSR